MNWKHEMTEKNLKIMKDLQEQATICFNNKDYIGYKHYMSVVNNVLILNNKIIFNEEDK